MMPGKYGSNKGFSAEGSNLNNRPYPKNPKPKDDFSYTNKHNNKKIKFYFYAFNYNRKRVVANEGTNKSL